MKGGVLNLCGGRRTGSGYSWAQKEQWKEVTCTGKRKQPVLLWPPLLSLKTSVISFNIMYIYPAIHFPQIHPFQNHSLQLLKD